MACFAEWMFYSAVAQIVLTVIAAYLLYRTLRESRKTNRIGLLGTAAARRANSAARKANDIAIESRAIYADQRFASARGSEIERTDHLAVRPSFQFGVISGIEGFFSFCDPRG